MNCKKVMCDFLACLNSYLDINPKTYDLISPMLQVRELGKNEVIVNEGEICRDQTIDFYKSYREPLTLFGEDDEQYFSVKHIVNNLGLQPSCLKELRGELGKNKSGLTKYLHIVFITLHFI